MIWPGKLQHRKLEEALNVTDIFPTLVFVAGGTVPEVQKADGLNFWSVLNGGSLMESRTMYWKTNNGFAVREGDWKLIHKGRNPDSGMVELYDMQNDPYETTDLAEKFPEKLQELKEEIFYQVSQEDQN